MHKIFSILIQEKMKFIIPILFFGFMFSSNLRSAYLENMPLKLTQPDGIVLNCFVSGDEFYNWQHDKDGYTIIKNRKTGYYTYAVRSGRELKASNYIVGQTDPNTLGLDKWLKIAPELIMEKVKNFEQHPGKPQIGKKEQTQVNKTGTIQNIVVYIRFNDESEFTDDTSTYHTMFNATSGNSMYAYFREVTYNTLSIYSTFYPEPPAGIVISYKDSHNRNYFQAYDPNDNPNGYQNSSERTSREHILLKDAIENVRSEIPSNLAIDNDNDGYVDNVCFIIYGSSDGWSDLLWPHMWVLYSQNATINGKRVWEYNFQLQTFLKNSGNGVLSHEMFHTLGSPDLYHYNQDNMQPVGKWDLMANTTNPPQHMGAWMKKTYGGWISSIPEITSGGDYSLNPITSSTNNCYKIASPNSPSQFFLLEYRKKNSTFESGLVGEGLLVYRIISDSVPSGNRNGPPDEVYIYRPGGTPSQKGQPDNAFFNSTVGRTAINDGTDPSSFLADGSDGGLSISNIGVVGNTISFTVGMGLMPPELVYPDDIIGGVAINDVLRWNVESFADSYTAQISTNSSFSSTVFEQSAISDTFVTISPNLNYASTYYWRVRSQEGSNLSEWANFRIFTTEIEAPILTEPGDNVYEIQLETTLRWESVTGANYYAVEVSENSAFSSTVIQKSGIGTTYYNISAGKLVNNRKYYWRVKAFKNSPSTYSVWSATRGFTSILASPEITSPIQDSAGVGLSGSLYWETVTGATAYNLQLADDVNFDNKVLDQNGLTNTTLPFSDLDYSTDYYWRVQAINSVQVGNWTESYHFITILEKPILSIPANSSGGVQIDARLDWRQVDGAETYLVQVAEDTAMTNIVIDAEVTTDTTFFCSGLSARTKYFWHINAKNSDGRISDWSDIWSFVTILGSPTIPSPRDSAEGVEIEDMLVWNTVVGAENYHIQLSAFQSLSSPIIDDSSITATSVAYFDLEPNKDYFWRVRAINSGNSGNWSKTWQFMTGLGGASLKSPPNNSVGISVNGTLSWNKMSGAQSYNLQVSTDIQFNTLIIDKTGLTGDTYAYTGLNSNTKYYWKISARTDSETSDWSIYWAFTTTAGEPLLAEPDDEAGGIGVSDILTWHPVNGAISYSIQISPNESMSDLEVDETDITDTSFVFDGFKNFTEYFWRVKAHISGGASPWSEIRKFSTVVATPELELPENYIKDAPTSGEFNWFSVNGASSYQLLVSENNDFSNPVIDESGISSDSYSYNDIEHNKQYNWKVLAENSDGNSEWSDTWELITVLAQVDLLSPKDSAIQVPVSGKIKWNSVDGYKKYRVQISEQKNFNKFVVDTNGLVFTFFDYPELQESSRYYWRVIVSNDNSTSDWSESWTFKTYDPTSVNDNNSVNNINFFAYPNPVYDVTSFEFNIQTISQVKLGIYNQLGQRIDVLENGTYIPGKYNIKWNTKLHNQGIYNAVLSVNGVVVMTKIAVIK